MARFRGTIEGQRGSASRVMSYDDECIDVWLAKAEQYLSRLVRSKNLFLQAQTREEGETLLAALALNYTATNKALDVPRGSLWVAIREGRGDYAPVRSHCDRLGISYGTERDV